jgi:hypothetical protein
MILKIKFFLSASPPPKVTWWRGGSLIDSSDKVISSDGATQNTMTLDKLSRGDLRAIFTCQGKRIYNSKCEKLVLKM